MARPKQKWTSEEEEALSAGVEKHGIGRWKTILDDSQFASSLANRTNVDLKDKWRNLTLNDGGSSSRRNVRTPRTEFNTNPPITYLELPTSSTDKRTAPSYKAMIYEALSSIEDPNGTDVSGIVNYIEPRYELPESFRRSLTSKLRKLVLKGDLEKMGNRYKIKDAPLDAETSQQEDVHANNVDDHNKEQMETETSAEPLPRETPEDAALVAAYQVSVAENMEQEAIAACRKEAKLAELLEESVVMLKLAEEIYERCSRDGVVYLPP